MRLQRADRYDFFDILEHFQNFANNFVSLKDENGNTEPDGSVTIMAGDYDANGNWDVYPAPNY